MLSRGQTTMRFSPVARNITKLLDLKSMRMLDHYCLFNPSPLTLKQFVQFGRTATEEESFHFVKKEVPVRVANIMKEINLLPSNLLQMPSMVTLQEWYAESFMELCAFEGRQGDRDTLKEFVETLATIQQRHSNAVQVMAQGVLELKESHAVDSQTESSIQYFLDRFYMSRISTRMLLNQHSMVFGSEDERDARDNRVGVIDTNCKLKSLVMEAYNNASFLCEEYYCVAPDINIKSTNPASKDIDEPIEICYPPQHLYHILFELFKNSMRAVIESRKKSNNIFDLPSLEVLLVKGEKDVTIRLSDQGGGIPRNVTDNLFLYLYSTAPRPSMTPEKAPLAGYGYGLPLSRLYARYFHGDLILNSYDGYGTDAVVYLKAHTHESVELLPVFNKTSTKQYKSSTPAADWSDPLSAMNRHYHPRQQTKVSVNP